MKKLLTLLLALSAALLLISGCGIKFYNPPYNEPPVPLFMYYMPVPDFLDKKQQMLYRKAFTVYGSFWHGNDGVEYFPLNKEQEEILSEDDLMNRHAGLNDFEPELFLNDIGYVESHGRYRNWADFEKVNLVVFTPDYLEELNNITAEIPNEDGSVITVKDYKQFISHDDKLFYVPVREVKRPGYAGMEYDSFELISSDSKEIKFNLIIYCTDSDGNLEAQPPAEIILTNTKNGWRFSKFAIGWLILY